MGLYEIIRNMIDHSWLTTNQGDQQYIYFICGAVIVLVTVVLIDLLYRTFAHFWRP